MTRDTYQDQQQRCAHNDLISDRMPVPATRWRDYGAKDHGDVGSREFALTGRHSN
jgi:hypothetical protein